MRSFHPDDYAYSLLIAPQPSEDGRGRKAVPRPLEPNLDDGGGEDY
jgi:hypothetical protein